jgi:tetratricopeptide (TPR) repeat protein
MGDHQRAVRLLEQALAVQQELGYERGIGSAQHAMAITYFLQGDHQRARTALRESAARAWKIGNRLQLSHSLDWFAAVAAADGQAEQAARLLGAAEALRESIHSVLTLLRKADIECTVSAIRAHLDEVSFSAAWQAGREMGAERAVEYALSADHTDLDI